MKCPRCREVASPKAKFCAGCGAELAARATPPGADAPPALGGGLERVLAAVARTAARLCDARDAQISLVEADCLRRVVHYGTLRSARAVGETYPLSRGIVSALAVLDRRTIHVRDLRAARTRFKELAAQVALGTRTVLATPLLRDGSAIGVILLQRKRVRPFTSKQIALLQAFADQAAIAIENARLFTELGGRNRELTEALAQQTATSEILRVIARSPADLQPVLDALVLNAGRLCQAVDTALLLVEGDQLRVAALDGSMDAPVGFSNPIHRGWVAGRAVVDAQTVHVEDLANADEAEFPLGRAIAIQFGHRTTLATPLLREGVPIGALFLRRGELRRFSDTEIALLETFADQAVIAIENARLFKELEARNRDLTEALEQQTATGEVLRVISRSAFDLGPVFETVVESAVRLCEADRAFIYRFDGEVLRMAVAHNVSPEMRAFVAQHPHRPGRQSAAARAALERRTVHIPDVLADPQHTYGATQVEPVRTLLGVPMLKGEELVGVILIYRLEFRPFTTKQIALMETFADQAVIAIENARLFNELGARNADLTEALEQQTATAEILRVISSSPTDVQPVFDAIARHAVLLCDGLGSVVVRYDGTLMRLAAHHNLGPEGVERNESRFPRPPDRTARSAWPSSIGRSSMSRTCRPRRSSPGAQPMAPVVGA